MLRLVSVGETTADFYPAIDQTFVGGISLNFAVHAKRCGIPFVSMVSAIGNDENGRLILSKLKQEKVDTSHISVILDKTAHCEIVVLENGERYFPPNSYHQRNSRYCRWCGSLEGLTTKRQAAAHDIAHAAKRRNTWLQEL